MSLMGTLAKVAIGVALAKGMQAVTQKASGQGSNAGNAGTGGLFGGAHSPAQNKATRAPSTNSRESMGSVLGGSAGSEGGASQGGLGGLLEQLAGGGKAAGGASGGGLGDLLGGLTGGRSGSSQAGAGGGLGDLLGGLLGGGAAAGGLGGLLGSLTGGGQPNAGPANNRSFGDMLNSSFNNQGEPEVEPTADQNAVAALMLSAMIQAAKADGEIQDGEKEKLLGNLGDVSEAEMAFVQAEMSKKVDIAALARHIPKGLEQQVYTMSVMAIDLDSQAEAQYLHDLATALHINKDGVNHIHAKLGVPALYA